jgi:hypothetical protein
MTCDPDLICDVGMHNGDGTADCLHKGDRVAAIAANPDLIGSTRAEYAARFGGAVRRARVRCMPFGDALRRFGVPLYLKIDIEGSDRLCPLAPVPPDLPRYVSIGMSHEDGGRDITRLAELGYPGLRCVRQDDLAVITPATLPRQLRLRRLRAREGLMGLCVGAARRAARLARPARDGAWRFPRGASGPFGNDRAGPWLTPQQILAVWQALRDIDGEPGTGGVGERFDIHAALRGANAPGGRS